MVVLLRVLFVVRVLIGQARRQISTDRQLRTISPSAGRRRLGAVTAAPFSRRVDA
ncbi:hypothetical protein [Kitasatospora sp. NPDC058190]|uniref:hypothetical protein n=1 Tax=Kitasatospora sp. NPDC058190 TaxID=3346371 RepID=UPI0036D7DE35